MRGCCDVLFLHLVLAPRECSENSSSQFFLSFGRAMQLVGS